MMEAFKETQEMKRTIWAWIFVLVASCALIPFVIAFIQHNKSIIDIWPMAILIIIVSFFLFFIKLTTRIDETGVGVKYGFFQRHEKVYNWNEIKSVEVRKYDPVFEYGGWGNRKRILKRKRAFSISGNAGMELLFHDDTFVMVGTKNQEGIKEYLRYLKNKKQIPALVNSTIK